MHAQQGGWIGKLTLKISPRLNVEITMATRGREVHIAIIGSNQKGKEVAQEEDTMEIETSGAILTKRNQGDKSSGKNTKRAKSVSRGIAPIPTAFWLGFVALEKLYIERGVPLAPTCIITGSVADKIKGGLTQIGAE